ncbi:MAG: hypothetical protein WCA46_28320 [Actinocatenispora sp.]
MGADRSLTEDLDGVVSVVVDALRPAVDQDWSVPAGTLDWSCRDTAEHLGTVFVHYAAQLAVRARTRYVRWVSRSPEVAPPAGVLEFVEGAGRICALTVAGTAPTARAFHPYGISDPEGFAGGCCIEALVHGYDIATGLGVPFDPPRDLCVRILARMFPHHTATLADADTDPWTALRWATGRADLPGLPTVGTWKWRATPLDEPWTTPTPEPMPFVLLPAGD